MGICVVEGCNRKINAHGYCCSHYARLIGRSKQPLNSPIKKMKKYEKHGLINTPEYKAWEGLKKRCYNQKNKSYKDYGGRGISICQEWVDSFISFLKDMGEKPFPEAQIDRINNDGNYEPGNCRWTTKRENCRNRRTCKLNYDLVDKIKKDIGSGYFLAKKYGVSSTTIYDVKKLKIWTDG